MNELLREIGLEGEVEETTASTEARESQIFFSRASHQDEGDQLQDAGREDGSIENISLMKTSPQHEKDEGNEIPIRQDTASKTENILPTRAEKGPQIDLQQDTAVQQKTICERKTAEQNTGIPGECRKDQAKCEQKTISTDASETQSNVLPLASLFHADQEPEEEEDLVESPRRTEEAKGLAYPEDDCQQPSHSRRPIQESCEPEKTSKKTQEGSSENMRADKEDQGGPSSQNREGRFGLRSDQSQTNPRGCSSNMPENDFADSRSATGAITDSEHPPMIQTFTRIQENQDFIPRPIRSQVSDGFQRHLTISGRTNCPERSSLTAPILSNLTGEQMRIISLRNGIGTTEPHPQAQNPSSIWNNRGRTSVLPPHMDNETSRYLPKSQVEGNNCNEDLRNNERDLAGSPEFRPPTPFPLLLQNPLSSDSTRGTPCVNENTEVNMQHRDPRLSTPIENLQTPVVSNDSVSPRFSRTPDDTEEKEEKNSPGTGDPCKSQGHQSKDGDDDDSDQEKFNTPKALRTAIGESRKLSPSEEEEQPRKRSNTGEIPEDGEVLKELQEFNSGKVKTTTNKQQSIAVNVTDEKELQEFAPLKAPHRPREYIIPPGMPPVFRFGLPEKFPEEPPLLGSGRRYKGINMPPVYVPPNFNEANNLQGDNRFGEGDSSVDHSEDERSLEECIEAQSEAISGRAVDEGVPAKVIESNNEGRSHSTEDLEELTFPSQGRVHARSLTSIPRSSSSQTLPIRSISNPSESDDGGYNLLEMVVWTESPKLPTPRKSRNHHIFRATRKLIYLVSPSTPTKRRPQELNQEIAIGFWERQAHPSLTREGSPQWNCAFW